MYLAYSVLLTLGLIVLIPHFLFQALAHGKYIAGIRQRLGAIPPLDGKPVILSFDGKENRSRPAA